MINRKKVEATIEDCECNTGIARGRLLDEIQILVDQERVDALKDVQQAIVKWEDYYRELGDAIPHPSISHMTNGALSALNALKLDIANVL